MITDVLEIGASDFASLAETRVFLEIKSAALAAERRTLDDIIALEKALKTYEIKLEQEGQAIEEDLLFHLKIAEAGKNKVLKSLILIIIPDIIKSYATLKVCNSDTVSKTIDEHRQILNHIIEQDTEAV